MVSGLDSLKTDAGILCPWFLVLDLHTWGALVGAYSSVCIFIVYIETWNCVYHDGQPTQSIHKQVLVWGNKFHSFGYQHSLFEHLCYITPKSTVLIENLTVHRHTTASPLSSVWLPQCSLWHRIVCAITDLHPDYTQVQTSKHHVYRLVALYPKHCPRYDLCMTASTKPRSGSIKSKDRSMKMFKLIEFW